MLSDVDMLTRHTVTKWIGLNTPYGAPCFLTGMVPTAPGDPLNVLMHLIVLHAF